MLLVLTRRIIEPNEEQRKNGLIKKHVFSIADTAVLTIDQLAEISNSDEDMFYHWTSWPVSRQGMEQYKTIMEMANRLKKRQEFAYLTVRFGNYVCDTSLDKFEKSNPREEYFMSPEFNLLNVVFDDGEPSTVLVYSTDSRCSPNMSVLSRFNMSDFLPKYVKRSSVYSSLVSEADIRAGLFDAHELYLPLVA